jgi:hypothetical protein
VRPRNDDEQPDDGDEEAGSGPLRNIATDPLGRGDVAALDAAVRAHLEGAKLGSLPAITAIQAH